jgi:DNA primase
MNKLDLNKIDVYEMLETLGMRNITDNGDEVMFSCPLDGHLHGDANPSASMNKDTTAWLCFGCKRKGNAISFLTQVYNITPLEAQRAIRNEYGDGFREPATSMRSELEGYLISSEKTSAPQRYLDDSILDMFKINDKAVKYFRERGIDEFSMVNWELGYDPISNRVTIPVRDETGRLVGIKGRDITGTSPAKYKVLGDRDESLSLYGFPTYEVSHILFGIDRYTYEKCEKMILCEGELNAISLWQKGFTGAVAIGGSHLSREHIKSIKKHAKQTILFFDSDEAGFAVTNDAMEELQPHMSVYLTPHHTGDPAEMSKEKISQCLEDAESSLTLLLP